MNTETTTIDRAQALPRLSPLFTSPNAGISRKSIWAGRIVSALPAILLLSSGVNLILKPAFVLEGIHHLGYAPGVALAIGMAALASALLYVIPRTSLLGAILLTAYLGGATASHVRIGEPFLFPVIAGVLVWTGLFLRNERLRALAGFRR